MEIVVPEEFKHLYVADDERPIVKLPAQVLRQKAAEIERVTKRHQTIADNMQRVMRAARGIGLAANQIGLLERIVVVQAENRTVVVFNPKIVESSGTQVGEEGCLSIPGLYGDVERAEKVVVEGLDRKGRESTWDMDGLAARVVQHEIDHLDGILFTDKVDPATVYWQHPSQKPERAE